MVQRSSENLLLTRQKSYLFLWKQAEEKAWVRSVKGPVLVSMLVAPAFRLLTQLSTAPEDQNRPMMIAAGAALLTAVFILISSSANFTCEKLKMIILLQAMQAYFLTIALCFSPESKERYALMSTVVFCVYELPSFHPRWLMMLVIMRQFVMWHVPCLYEGTGRNGSLLVGMLGAALAIVFCFASEIRRKLSEHYRFCEYMNANESKLNAILQAIPEALAVITQEHGLVSSNLLMQNLLSPARNSLEMATRLKSLHCFESLQTEQLKSVSLSTEIAQFLTETNDTPIAVFGVTKSADVFYEWKGTKCQWDQEVACILTVSDISPWMLTQRRLQGESNSKSAMLKFVSHELKTPANAIINLATSVMEADNLAPEQRHILAIVVASTHYFVSVVNDLMDFTRMMAGKFALAKEMFEVRREVRETVDLMEAQCRAKGLFLRLHMDDLIPQRVFSDQYRLKQVLLNLLGNAVKFTYTGSIHIICMLTSHNFLKISVQDTGIGISCEQLKELNATFKAADNLNGLNPQDCGLGLYISNLIAVNLGPTGICIQSTPGQGSTFSFELEIAATSSLEVTRDRRDSSTDISQELNTPIVMSASLLCAGHSQGEVLSNDVLVVDDLGFNRMVLLKMLTKHDIIADEACSGLQAVTLIRKKIPLQRFYRFILMDLEMAEMDGFEATGEIRAMEGAGELPVRTIIVACSAHTGTEVVQKCMSAGMDDFIEKPVSREKLRKVIEKYYEINR